MIRGNVNARGDEMDGWISEWLGDRVQVVDFKPESVHYLGTSAWVWRKTRGAGKGEG